MAWLSASFPSPFYPDHLKVTRREAWGGGGGATAGREGAEGLTQLRGADLINQNSNRGDERTETVPCSARRRKQWRPKQQDGRSEEGQGGYKASTEPGRGGDNRAGECCVLGGGNGVSESLNSFTCICVPGVSFTWGVDDPTPQACGGRWGVGAG